uniref:Uncharacterized protein n=1 Tax=Knipowitschia caucasica TaxID=637954 RepID=A0AAV2KKU2_KNICA
MLSCCSPVHSPLSVLIVLLKPDSTPFISLRSRLQATRGPPPPGEKRPSAAVYGLPTTAPPPRPHLHTASGSLVPPSRCQSRTPEARWLVIPRASLSARNHRLSLQHGDL